MLAHRVCYSLSLWNKLFHVCEQIWTFSLLGGKHHVFPQAGVYSKEILWQSPLITSLRAEIHLIIYLFLIKIGSWSGPLLILVEISNKNLKTLDVQCEVILWSFEKCEQSYQCECHLRDVFRSHKLYFHHYLKRNKEKV